MFFSGGLMNDLVSIIIPVYNVEKHLDRCVESVVNQTYKNLEIILVDDGSPDNCPQMCDEWANKDTRIRVIHKENGGLSSARNAGLDIMNGKYVYFIDSDDYISDKTIELLYNGMNENNADMVFARFVRFYDDNFLYPYVSNEIVLFNENSFWKSYYEMIIKEDVTVDMIISCNKLIKSSVFNELRFEIGKYHEDEFIIHLLINKCKNIVFIDSILYYYYQNPTSIMYTNDNRKVFNANEALAFRCIYFAQNNKDYTEKAFSHFFWKFRYDYFDLKSDSKMKKAAKSLYRKAYTVALPYLKNRKLKLLSTCLFLNDYLFRIVNKISNG